MINTQFIIIFIVIIIVAYFYQAWLASNKVLCRIIMHDGTIGKKWVRFDSRRFEYRKAFRYIITEKIMYDKMWFGMLPYRVLEYKAGGSVPIDPQTGRDDYELDPELRAALDTTDEQIAMSDSAKKALNVGKVQGFMGGGLMPILLLVGLLATVFFVFKLRGQVDQLGAGINVIQEMLMKKGF